MSVLNKKPFIKTLIGSLTKQQRSTLASLIDGEGNRTAILRTLNRTETSTRTHITNSDKGVKICNLEFNYSLYDGYLLFNNSYCVLLSYTDSQQITIFSINSDKNNLTVVNEVLSILELRSELDDLSNNGTEVTANPTLAGTENELTGLEVNGTKYKVPQLSEGLPYLTTAPTSANTNGKLIPVVLSSEPATKYSGYLYFIVEA